MSEMDRQRVLRNEVNVVRDERKKREEVAELIEYQEEEVNCLDCIRQFGEVSRRWKYERYG